MHIFIAVRHSIDPHYFYGELWSNNFYPALHKLGHDLFESQVDLLPASRFMDVAANFTLQEREVRARITQQIIDEVRRAHKKQSVDLFLSYFYNAHFDSSGFDAIHQLGIPTINFYCNSIHQFALVAEIAPKVTYAWHAERDARTSYVEVGANPVWVQMGADPEVYRPLPSIKRQPKACFVGQRYADRDRLLTALLKANTPVDIYGSGWPGAKANRNGTATLNDTDEYLGRQRIRPGSRAAYWQVIQQNIRQHRLLAGLNHTWQQQRYRQESRQLDALLKPAACGRAPTIPETFAAYELILNFSNVWANGQSGSVLIPHVRLRDFEGPMCRTCYLTGYSDEITEFYNLGQEIDTYRDKEELVDKARFYLNHPNSAEKLREAGYRRAIQEHTWECRFLQLFQEVGLK